MALKFIGERTVGTLNGMKSGFVKDDLYRVYDAGILVPGGVSVDHGDFVSWDGTKWVLEADIEIARSDEITNTNSSIAPEYTKKTYEANSYVMQDGVLYTNPNAIGTAEDWNPAHWAQTSVGEFISKIKDPTALEVCTIENALPRNTRITALSCEFLFNPFTGECTCNGSFTLSGSQTLSKNSADLIQDYDSEYGLVAELAIDPNSYEVPIIGRATGSILSITASNAPAVSCVFIVDGSNTVGIIAAKSSFSVLSGGKYVCTTSIIKPS